MMPIIIVVEENYLSQISLSQLKAFSHPNNPLSMCIEVNLDGMLIKSPFNPLWNITHTKISCALSSKNYAICTVS